MRGLLVAAALTLMTALAQADAPPVPGRPEFDDTPLPMPDPLEAAALGVALLGGVAIMRSRRRHA